MEEKPLYPASAPMPWPITPLYPDIQGVLLGLKCPENPYAF